MESKRKPYNMTKVRAPARKRKTASENEQREICLTCTAPDCKRGYCDKMKMKLGK